MKTIKVTNDTHEKLQDLGKKGDTFNDIIKRLIEENIK